jgi:BirA family transcriptional regulator, biotin operon repressor / biotin---[acetyl-CoA-carboxylase] ligase
LSVNFKIVQTTGSTNTDLLNQPFETAPAPPSALLTKEQTAGRGRRGRNWTSELEQSLTFSVAFEQMAMKAQSLQGLSLVVAMTLASSLQTYFLASCPSLKIKWPNDLVIPITTDQSQLLGLKKVAGILIETRRQNGIERIVIGVGLNLFEIKTEAALLVPSAVEKGHIKGAIMSAQQWQSHSAATRPVPPDTAHTALARHIAQSFAQMWSSFVLTGWSGFSQEWTDLDVLVDQTISLIGEGGTAEHGRYAGLDAQGYLLIEQNNLIKRIVSADISLRLFDR